MYLTKEMSGNSSKPEFKIVDGKELKDGVYLRDTDYVDFGAVVNTIVYEHALRVVEIETGQRIAIIIDEFNETTYKELGKK